MTDAPAHAQWQTVLVEKDDGIAWITLNRPEKRNAMNPRMHYEMNEILDVLEQDDEVSVLVLTGAGEAWCAGQDIQEFFRDLDAGPPAERRRVHRLSTAWRWHRLNVFPKPTIAMVNGYCFGGGFTQLVACDFAFAAEDAVFGLSEVNWGIYPGGLASRAAAEAMPLRDAMYYIMTGETFDGRKADQMRLVTRAVPADQLRETTLELARKLQTKNPVALQYSKEAHKTTLYMNFHVADEYNTAKSIAVRAVDQGYEQGMSLFLDDKRYRPGFSSYRGAEPVPDRADD